MLIDYLLQYGQYNALEELINEVKKNYSAEDQQALAYAMGMVYLAQKKNDEAFEEFKKLHEAGYIKCEELKDIKGLKKAEGFAEFIKKCANK